MRDPGRVPKYQFWPEKEPGPVDEAYRQTRWLRPYRPGPYRVAVCLFLLALLMYATMVSLLAVYGSGGIPELGLRIIIAGVVYAGLVLAAVRAFLSGVWVTDAGVRVVRPLSTRVWTWADIADVRSVPGPTRLLGTPVRVGGNSVFLVLSDGTDVETPLADRSADFLGRAEAYDMASSAVEGWLEQNRRRRRRSS